MAQQPHFALRRTIAPTAEPITLAAAKAHLRVSIPDEDDVITRMLRGARAKVESDSGRALMPSTWLMALDRFPLLPNSQYSPGNPNIQTPVVNNVWPLDASAWAIVLPRSPLIAVTSIQYTATDLSTQTMDPSTYLVDSLSEPPRLSPPAGAFWPATVWKMGAVQVTFQAGYATADLVPEELIDAIYLLLGHRYENREAVTQGTMTAVPMGYDSLIAAGAVASVW